MAMPRHYNAAGYDSVGGRLASSPMFSPDEVKRKSLL